MTVIPNLPDVLAHALEAHGFDALTEVQSAVLDVVDVRRDMLVSAQTGSGKTLAFGLALGWRVLGEDGLASRGSRPKALIIAPTRELAQQVTGELGWLYADSGARIVCCTGGMDMRIERAKLHAGCEIVVGSPGRLRDHIERGDLETAGIGCVVVDEADDMLDLGFRDDLGFIMASTPAEHQVLMFSATITARVEELAAAYQHDILRVSAAHSGEPPATLRFEAMAIAPCDRESAIVNILRLHDAHGAMVFCARREGVAHLASRLGMRGFKVVALSGALPQHERNAAVAAMRDGRARVCVATDLAARGLDLPRLELVIHADLPETAAVLTHRSGRTGRAGREGLAVIVVPPAQRRRAEALFTRASVHSHWTRPPGPEEIRAKDEAALFATDPLVADVSAEERATATRLLGRFDAEVVAIAFLREHMANLPVPGVLIAPAGDLRDKRPRIKDGIWFALNCGGSGPAQVRSILPLICRLGHITKHDIGRIVVCEAETRFEVRPDAVPDFESWLGSHREAGREIRRHHAARPKGAGGQGA